MELVNLQERFVRSPDGRTYEPKAGHDEEVAYRLAMRSKDQEDLVHKRKAGRNSNGGCYLGTESKTKYPGAIPIDQREIMHEDLD